VPVLDRTDDRRDLLIEAGLALASELSLDVVLRRIVELAMRITNATYGALGVLGPGDQIVDFITVGVSGEQRELIGHPPVGRGILGALIEDAKPLRLTDITDDPRSVGFPPNHPPMRSFLGAPVTSRGRVFGNIYLTEKRGADRFNEEDERALVILAAQAGVAVENARLYESARRGERRLELIREIGYRILEGDDAEDLLRLVAARARDLTGAAVAMVSMPDAGSEKLRVQVAVGDGAPDVEGLVVPVEGSLSGEAIREGKVTVLADARSDPRAHQPMIAAANMGPSVFVPLTGTSGPFGTLAVANPPEGRAFTEDDVAVVETFASQASVALEYAQARRELERMAVLEDRERIAKELHDGVIQSLFAVGMGLQATGAMAKDPEIDRRIEGSVNEVDRVIRDLRNYIFGLRPGILADRQLDQALRLLAEEFEAKTGVVTVVDVVPDVAAELASRAGDVVQLVREALSNVGRHAEATTCRITLARAGDRNVLEIDDDGTGFDPTTVSGSGQGLGNLRARAESLGGGLEIQSDPGQGTTVRAMLPR
jgi:signal transduction histidine kinase